MYTSLDLIAELARELFWTRIILAGMFLALLANLAALTAILSCLKALESLYRSEREGSGAAKILKSIGRPLP